MNYKMIRYFFGIMLMLEAAFMLIPTATALIYSEDITPFIITIGILLFFGIPSVAFKPNNTRIYAKEGFICVAAAWILLSLFGALPFVISGAIPNYIDAFFETVSGFTTTGATILCEIESLPRGILLWRSFTHWFGGMGVLVFMLALFPSGDGQTIHLMRAEVPGPVKGKLVPKIKRTAMILYGIYFALTVVQTVALLCTGMPFYDSLVNSFATAGTGGFSVKNQSIMSYENPAAEWVIAVFMFIFGVNFNLFYLMLVKHIREVLKNEELRSYLIICLVATGAVALSTYKTFDGFEHCLRTSFFQVTSIISTTGFSTTDFNLWHIFPKTVLTVLMFIGACAGSTAGGLKVSRVMILFKSIRREIKHMLKPRSVNIIRIDGEVIPEENVKAALNYFALYIVLIIISTVLLSVDGLSMETNITAAVTCINNVGPGFDTVGPMGNFSTYSAFSKIVLSLDMLLGRLEIMPMFILFSPMAWKKR